MAEDNALISRAKSGDEQAFAELMRAHYAFVYRIVVEIVNNPHDAEEVVQGHFPQCLPRFDRSMRKGPNSGVGWRKLREIVR